MDDPCIPFLQHYRQCFLGEARRGRGKNRHEREMAEDPTHSQHGITLGGITTTELCGIRRLTSGQARCGEACEVISVAKAKM